jgi:hypothetical protein
MDKLKLSEDIKDRLFKLSNNPDDGNSVVNWIDRFEEYSLPDIIALENQVEKLEKENNELKYLVAQCRIMHLDE